MKKSIEYMIKWLQGSLLICLVLAISFANAQTPTTDLTTHQPTAAPPSGATFEWHNALPVTTSSIVSTPTAVAPGIYYGVYNLGTCYSAVSPIKVLTNTCPIGTVDISKAVETAGIPPGMVITYHNGYPVSASNQILGTLVTEASAGTYYAAYYDAVGGCYSLPSPIVVVGTPCQDTDGDGVVDIIDLDDDNDGILDTLEDGQLSADTDGDGVPNRLDLDSDNDGINDVIEAGGVDANKDGIADGVPSATGIPSSAGTGDTLVGDDQDGDTRPNPYDLDSDNDGINDLVESGNPLLLDANGDGMVDGTDTDGDGILGAADGLPATRGDASDPAPVDTDGDGLPNYKDLDSDGDGLTDLLESGIPDPATLDANNDGKIDSTIDPDGDGIVSPVDGLPAVFGDSSNPVLPDTDGDGTPDYVDPTDTDGDGVADATDLDDDNDGILDTVENATSCTTISGVTTTNADCDSDGIPNQLDLDSDNDGINDVLEAGGTDVDGNGNADGAVSETGIPASAGTGLTPPNTDGQGGADPYDLDSDNDNISDLSEGGLSSSLDADNDGKVDCTTNCDPDNDGILTPVDAIPTTWGDAILPDLSPTTEIASLEFLTGGAQKDFVVNVFEINNVANVVGKAIAFRVAKLSAFDITYATTSGVSNVFSAINNSNSDWTFTENANFITVTAKSGITIPAGGSKIIGFKATRKTGIPQNTSQNITVTIIYGSAGEEKVDNNIVETKITAN